MPGSHVAARRWGRALLFALALAALAGCARKLYPVTGKVVFKDGSPLRGGMVVFSPVDPESHVGARGYIQADGTFELSTAQPGDGSLEGRYRVLVRPPLQGRGEDDPLRKVPLIDLRYTQFETSGIEVEVKPGKNELTIEVDRPASAGRKP
jgi:hypothetical protein